MNLVNPKSIFTVLSLVLMFLFTNANAATIYFNTIYSGSASSNSINNIVNVAGAGFSFTSFNPNDANFVASGNDVSGNLSFINSSDQVITMSGLIGRQNKSGSTTNGLYFYPTSNPTIAYLLVIPGRESQFTSGGSYTSSSDTGNTVAAMNSILVTQQTQPVIKIDSPAVTEGNTYLIFQINFTNNSARTGTSSFTLMANSGSALLSSDFTSSIQYSFNQSTWSNVSGAVNFAATEPNMFVRVPILDDTLKECTETMTLETGIISGGNTLNSGGVYGSGTINDLENYYVWTGSISSLWNNSANWVCGDIPVTGGNIVISATAANDLELDQNRIVGYLKFCDAGKKVKPMSSELEVLIVYNGNSTNYIQTTTVGKLKMNILNAASKFFPVGNSSYNPVTISNNSGNSDNFGVNILDEVYVNGYSGASYTTPRVKRTWDISKQNSNSSQGIDFVFNWNDNETVNLNNPRLYHFNGTSWDRQSGTTSSTSNSLRYSGYLGTFSPFAISNYADALPVTLTSFNAECAGNNVNLKWQTLSEHNSSLFIIENSYDGINWKIIDQVNGAGQSSEVIDYNFLLDNQRGIQYYRLIQKDYDGKETCYGPISSECDFEETNVTVYPNPTEQDFELKIESVSNETYTAVFKTEDGKIIDEFVINLVKGINLIPMKYEGLTSGIYSISILNNDQGYFKKVVIK